MMNNTVWAFWLFVAIVFFVVEASTVNLTTIWFGIAAVVTMITALITDNYYIQAVVFIAVALLMLFFTKPVVAKYLKPKQTNALTIIGQQAPVTETVDNLNGKGQIKINGNTWTARSVENEIIEKGSVVTVAEIKGVTAYVKK